MQQHVDRAGLFGESAGAAERIAPGHFPATLEHDHLARYRWASRWVRGRGVLDVACGTAYGQQWLVRAGACRVVAADRSVEALAYGAREFGASTVCVDAHRLPFPDRTFEVVVSLETIEHVLDAPRFAVELARVLVDGGQLLLSTPNLARSSRDNPHHIREFTRRELSDLLKESGLEVRRVWGQHWRPRWEGWARTPALRRLAWEIEKPSRVTAVALPGSEPVYFCVRAVRVTRRARA
jgi:ubiquinone/menaquinone biosynthesis C-methylase UbiE